MGKRVGRLGLGLLMISACFTAGKTHASERQLSIALALADVIRASRTEIASQQTLMNDPNKGDKGLSADVIVGNILKRLADDGKADPSQADASTLEGRLKLAQIAAIREIADESQTLINKKGVGFKGIVPAVFTRLVNERFGDKVGTDAELKITAPVHLVRNRKARPDKWERSVLEDKFSDASWPTGQLFSQFSKDSGRDAFRVMVPEYYGQDCLACHGSPKGETDITGYPKEGGFVGDLGGSISITLYQ